MNDNYYYDEDLENELNNLALPMNIKLKLDENIELEFSDDELFIKEEERNAKKSPKKGSHQKVKKVQIDDNEIKQLCMLYDKKLEEEILKEEADNMKPLNFVEESDKERAKQIIEADEFIGKAYTSGIITFEEIAFFVDYYEIFSLINKTKTLTLDNLNKISDLYQDEEVWGDLHSRLAKTLSITDSIIDFDMTTFDFSNLPINEEFDKVFISQIQNLDDKVDNVNKDSSLNGTGRVPRPKTDSNFKREKKVLAKRQKIAVSAVNSHNTDSVGSTISHSNNNSSSNFNKLRSSIELFNSENKMANLPRLRNDRKEILKSKIGLKPMSKRPDLFNFDTLKNPKDDNMDLKARFMELLELPKEMIEKDKNMDSMRKSFYRRKIDDAINYYKNNMN